MKISQLVKLPDFFTLLNAASGFLGILYAIKQSFITAALLMILAVFFELVYSALTKTFGTNERFGKQLVALSGAISFVVAPAIFGYVLMDAYSLVGNNIVTILILLFFVCCGILRQARASVSAGKYHEGVPVHYNGIVFPVLYLIVSYISTSYIYALMFFYFIAAILMISSIQFRVRK